VTSRSRVGAAVRFRQYRSGGALPPALEQHNVVGRPSCRTLRYPPSITTER
jgi:hypothetical protein